MAKLLLLNKPFQTLCQFTDKDGRATLASYIDNNRFPGFYPAGRLDFDSEGLLALTDNGSLQHQLADPRFKLPKTYWVQVEGPPNTDAIQALEKGVELKDGWTRPCQARLIDQPALWQREPPVRFRKDIPTHWLQIILTEGKNRQVRRMTAAVGLPTLRLVRAAIGQWHIESMLPGELRVETVHTAKRPATKNHRRRVRSPRL